MRSRSLIILLSHFASPEQHTVQRVASFAPDARKTISACTVLPVLLREALKLQA